MDLGAYLRVFRRRWRWVVLCVVGCLALGALLTQLATPRYSSTARLFVSTARADAVEAYQGGLFSAERVRSYADLVRGRELAEAVADEVDPDLSPVDLAARVSARVVPETVILEITVTDRAPERAQRLAQEYAEQLTLVVRELETPPGRRNAPIKATIVESASYSESPVFPRPARNLGLALLVGVLVGAAVAVLRELLDTSVTSAGDIEQVGTGPVMGVISVDPHTPVGAPVTTRDPDSPTAEAYRVLRTNLQFLDVDGTSQVLAVTSSLAEEGKTTIAVNLAIAMAQAGRRTVLVECDLRRPRVASVLDLDSAVGLTTVLLGTVGWGHAVQRHRVGGVDVLTSGPIPPNPAELVQSAALENVLAELRAAYEVVILDAPPLLPVTDAAVLGSRADAVIMAVRYGRTTRDQLRLAVERLQHVNARLAGFVLSMVPPRRHAAEYGYRYGYATAAQAETSPRRGRGSPVAPLPVDDEVVGG